jgi:hypothetical protein
MTYEKTPLSNLTLNIIIKYIHFKSISNYFSQTTMLSKRTRFEQKYDYNESLLICNIFSLIMIIVITLKKLFSIKTIFVENHCLYI